MAIFHIVLLENTAHIKDTLVLVQAVPFQPKAVVQNTKILQPANE
jgi:hypothetical protein